MKCEKCNNEIKIKNAKFCPFCGVEIKERSEFAPYTRAQYFSLTGDDEFCEAWKDVRNMNADEALSWFREHPQAKYIYSFFGVWNSTNDTKKIYRRSINRNHIKRISMIGSVCPKRYKLTMDALGEIGEEVFLTEEECNSAIMEEINGGKNEN